MNHSVVDVYVAQHQGLVEVHRVLTEGLKNVTKIEEAHQLGGFLLGHHQVESQILFPGLRKHGRLRSTDVAFLDARDAEHRAIHHLCERFTTDPTLAPEILALFVPHIEEEERGLSPDNLRAMITEAGLAEINRELEEMRRSFQQGGRGTTSG